MSIKNATCKTMLVIGGLCRSLTTAWKATTLLRRGSPNRKAMVTMKMTALTGVPLLRKHKERPVCHCKGSNIMRRNTTCQGGRIDRSWVSLIGSTGANIHISPPCLECADQPACNTSDCVSQNVANDLTIGSETDDFAILIVL